MITDMVIKINYIKYQEHATLILGWLRQILDFVAFAALYPLPVCAPARLNVLAYNHVRTLAFIPDARWKAMRYWLFVLVALMVPVGALAQDNIIIRQRSTWKEDMTYFDQEHDETYIWDVLEELSGHRPAAGATREQLAAATIDLLAELPAYGQKQTPAIEPAVPRWFMDGYLSFNPTSISHSRYLDAVWHGDYAVNPDIVALYTAWSTYDAEWFVLSRHADFKAWFTAMLLTFAPDWHRLSGEEEWALHNRLVVPLQTPDEPYREIDNWITNFTKVEGSFLKPKVRDALVQELLSEAGLETDIRYYDDAAYEGPTPGGLGLTDRQFYLLAALAVELHYEIYAQSTQKEILHFRDYFLSVYQHEMRISGF